MQEHKKGKHKKPKGVDVMMTQNQMIVKYIEDFGSITHLEAYKELGIMRLASRISELKEKGYPIDSVMVKSKNRYGKPMHYAKYFFKKGETANVEQSDFTGKIDSEAGAEIHS